MTRHERVRYEMLLRVRDFGTTHRGLFPESSSGHKAFATVTRAVEQIDTHNTARDVAVRESHVNKTARRKVILDRMRRIARTSTSVAVESGALLQLKMPKRSSDVAVSAAARTFLTQAEAYHDQFVALGLPATCLTDLREALDAFEAAMTDRRLGRAGVAAAQAGIKAALTTGANAARTLDVVVLNTVGHDPSLVAAWQRDRRIVEGTTKATPSSDTATPEVVTAPAAPAAGETTSEEPAAPVDPLRRAS